MSRRGKPTNVYDLDRYRWDVETAALVRDAAARISIRCAAASAGLLAGELRLEGRIVSAADKRVLAALADGCNVRGAARRTARLDTIALGEHKRSVTLQRKADAKELLGIGMTEKKVAP